MPDRNAPFKDEASSRDWDWTSCIAANSGDGVTGKRIISDITNYATKFRQRGL